MGRVELGSGEIPLEFDDAGIVSAYGSGDGEGLSRVLEPARLEVGSAFLERRVEAFARAFHDERSARMISTAATA